jgi:hypothetical protein
MRVMNVVNTPGETEMRFCRDARSRLLIMAPSALYAGDDKLCHRAGGATTVCAASLHERCGNFMKEVAA